MCVCVYRAHYNFFFCWVPIARAYRVCAMCVCVCLIPFHSPPYIEKKRAIATGSGRVPRKNVYIMFQLCVCCLCVCVRCARYHHMTMVVFLEKIDFFFCRLELHILFPLFTIGCRVHTNTAQINIPFCIYIYIYICVYK